MTNTLILSNLTMIILLTLLAEFNCAQLRKNETISKNATKITIFVKDDVKISSNQSPLNLYSYFQAKVEKCTNKECIQPTGICINTNICQCSKGYADVPLFSENNKLNCQYKQKFQIVAFILEFFSFCGLGHLYTHRIIIFFLKFMIFLIVLLVRYNYNFYKNEKKSLIKTISQINYYIFLSAFILYHLLDSMMFYLNKYTDGYGVPMNDTRKLIFSRIFSS